MDQNQNSEQTPSQENQQNSFSIPEVYAGKGWAQNVKSIDDLYSQFDNLQSKLGKRPEGIPTKDASEDQWNEFYKLMGRPEKFDKYEFDLKGMELPQGLDLSPYEVKAKEMFFKMGLSSEKANQAWRDYIGMEIEGEKARQAELDKQYDELGSSLFGDSFDNVAKEAQDYLKQNLPEELFPVVESMQNNPKSLLALIHVVNKAQKDIVEIKKQYGKEDRLQSGDGASGDSVADIQRKMNEARDKIRKADIFSKERKDAENELNALRDRLKRSV